MLANSQVHIADENGNIINSFGSIVRESFDKIDATYPNDVTEIYTYSKGGSTTSVVTVVYTNNEKTDLLSVTIV